MAALCAMMIPRTSKSKGVLVSGSLNGIESYLTIGGWWICF